MKKILLYSLVLVIISGPVFAGGRPEGPVELNVDPQERSYISPGVRDGVSDVLEVELASVIEIPAKSSVTQYEFNVFDSNGNLVYRQFDGRRKRITGLGAVKWSGPNITVPQSLSWDGTHSEGSKDGSLAEDGDYTYQVVITDVLGNEVESPPLGVTVDNVAPVVDEFTRTSNAVFSPNDDGIRDEATVYQSGSREFRWDVEIRDSGGAVVRSQRYENTDSAIRTRDIPPPASFMWDGRDNSGSELPDGTYLYVLQGSDRAGNVTAAKLPRALVINRGADLLVLLPKDGGEAAFSPNGDGSRDALELEVLVYEPDAYDGWSLSFAHVDNPDETLFYRSNSGEVPDDLLLEGLDLLGNPLEDGDYEAMVVLYSGGSEYAVSTLPVLIDTVAPRVAIAAQTVPTATRQNAPFVFGGDDKPRINFSVTGDPTIDWHGVATLDEAPVIRESLAMIGMSEGELSIDWDGVGPDGVQVADGLYEVKVDGYDAAGNYGASMTLRVRKDVSKADVDVVIDKDYVSPTAEGPAGYVGIRPQYSFPDSIDEFHLEIYSESGRLVRGLYKRDPFSLFEWRGFTNSNMIVDDGEYFVTFRVKYFNGNSPEITGVGPIIVDRTPPQVELLSAEYRIFSPNGDGLRDVVPIQQRAEMTGAPWKADIISADNRVVRSIDFGEEVADYVWDGTDNSGNILPDGDYLYMLSSVDPAENVGQASLALVIDTGQLGALRWKPDALLTVGPLPFTPDGDGENDTLNIEIAAGENSGIVNWAIDIVDPQGEVFTSFGEEGSPDTTISWEGTSESGELLQSATDYKVVLRATDAFGNIGMVEEALETGIFVIQEEDGRLRIRIPSIYFGGYLSDFLIVNEEQLESNLSTVRTLARVLNKYEDYAILIEGHASHLLWADEGLKEREQEEVLLPLSRSRAENVRRALIILGVDRNRMRTEGLGGANPVTPHDDTAGRWKNRRVEFILDR